MLSTVLKYFHTMGSEIVMEGAAVSRATGRPAQEDVAVGPVARAGCARRGAASRGGGGSGTGAEVSRNSLFVCRSTVRRCMAIV